MNERNRQLRIVSNQLVWSLAALVAVGIPGAVFAHWNGRSIPTPLAVLFVGLVGGFVGLQRRLKALPPEGHSRCWRIRGSRLRCRPSQAPSSRCSCTCSSFQGYWPATCFPPSFRTIPAQPRMDSGRSLRFTVRIPPTTPRSLFWSFVAGSRRSSRPTSSASSNPVKPRPRSRTNRRLTREEPGKTLAWSGRGQARS